MMPSEKFDSEHLDPARVLNKFSYIAEQNR